MYIFFLSIIEMIYDTNSDYFWYFLKDAQKAEQKWEKKFGDKPKIDDTEKLSYIDFINSHTK